MRELVDQFSQEQIHPVSAGLHEASEIRRELGAVTLRWPDSVYDYGLNVRHDPIISTLRERRDTFAPLFAGFHDKVFLAAKQDAGAIIVEADKLSDDTIRSFARKNVIEYPTHKGALYSQRYEQQSHGKLFADQVNAPLRLMQDLDLDAHQSYRLATAPDGAIALHTLYTTWDKIESDAFASADTAQAASDYMHHLEDIQMAGITNLIAMLCDDSTEPDLDQLLRLMNAAYSLDNPTDPFSQRSFEDPVVQHETDFDWRIINRAIELFGKQDKFKDAITEGSERFGPPARQKPIVLSPEYQAAADKFTNDRHKHTLEFFQLLEDTIPDFASHWRPPENIRDKSPAEAIEAGMQAAVKFTKQTNVRFYTRRPVMEMPDASPEELTAAYAPHFLKMLQEWADPVVGHFEKLHDTYADQLAAQGVTLWSSADIWDFIRENGTPDLSIFDQPAETQSKPTVDSYVNWSYRLRDVFPYDYKADQTMLLNFLHQSACKDLTIRIFQSIDADFSQKWRTFISTAYEDVPDEDKAWAERLAHEALVDLPARSR